MAKRIKILHIVWKPDIGGAEEFILSLSREHMHRHAVAVCFLGTKGPMIHEFERAGIEIKTIGMRNGFDVFSALRFFLFVKKGQFDVIHVQCHNFLMNACLRFIKNVPKILTEGGGECLVEELWKTRLIYRLFASNYKKIIVHSEYIRKLLIREAGVDPDKISLVHYGIDINKFSVTINTQKKKDELGIKTNTKVVGIIGRLVKRKGTHFFIRMAHEILRHEPEVDFLIIGDGPLRKPLEEMVKSLGVEKKIKFLGFRRDIPELLSLMDVFALTSEYEPFGIVSVEAMASGVPVAGFSVGGIPEAVIHNETGILVPEKDPLVLAKDTIHLLRNEELKKRMGQNGQRRARLYFDIRASTEKIEQIYEEYLH